ncbi:hypothetical protein TVAGG3_0913760, partial [Trichomonas vaginalis G3]
MQRYVDSKQNWFYFCDELLHRSYIDALNRENRHLTASYNWNYFMTQLKLQKIYDEHDLYVYKAEMKDKWLDFSSRILYNSLISDLELAYEKYSSSLRIFDLIDKILHKLVINSLKESKQKLDSLRSQKFLLKKFRIWNFNAKANKLYSNITRQTFESFVAVHMEKSAVSSAKTIQKAFRMFSQKKNDEYEHIRKFFYSWVVYRKTSQILKIEIPSLEFDLKTDFSDLLDFRMPQFMPNISMDSVNDVVSYRNLQSAKQYLQLMPFEYLSITDPEAKFMPIFFDVPRECYDKLTSAIPVEVGLIYSKTIQAFDITMQTKFSQINEPEISESSDLMDGFFQAISHSEFGETEAHESESSILIPREFPAPESESLFQFSPINTDIIFESESPILDIKDVSSFKVPSKFEFDTKQISKDLDNLIPDCINKVIEDAVSSFYIPFNENFEEEDQNSIDSENSGFNLEEETQNQVQNDSVDKDNILTPNNSDKNQDSTDNENQNQNLLDLNSISESLSSKGDDTSKETTDLEENQKESKSYENNIQKEVKTRELSITPTSSSENMPENQGLSHRDFTIDITLDEPQTKTEVLAELSEEESDDSPFAFEDIKSPNNSSIPTIELEKKAENKFTEIPLIFSAADMAPFRPNLEPIELPTLEETKTDSNDKFMFTIDESITAANSEIDELDMSLTATLFALINEAINSPMTNLTFQAITKSMEEVLANFDLSPLTSDSLKKPESSDSSTQSIEVVPQSPLPSPKVDFTTPKADSPKLEISQPKSRSITLNNELDSPKNELESPKSEENMVEKEDETKLSLEINSVNFLD